jgi:hypothetical protein
LNQIGTFDLSTAGSTLPASDSSWLMKIIYTGNDYEITTRTQDYIFESNRDVRFFFASDYKSVDATTGKALRDEIKILSVNKKPNIGTGTTLDTNAIGKDIILFLNDVFTYPDGYNDPRRVVVEFSFSDNSGIPDDPETFIEITGIENETDVTFNWYHNKDKVIFYDQYTDEYGYQYYEPDTTVFVIDAVSVGDNIALNATSSPWWPKYNGETQTEFLVLLKDQTNVSENGVYVYNTTTQLFSIYLNSIPTLVFDIYYKLFWQLNTYTNIWSNPTTGSYIYQIGRNNLSFLWKHYAPHDHRIDPAITNIIDIYVLTSQYDTDLRNWIKTSGSPLTIPKPPTETELRNTFSSLEDYKMISDTIIWRPGIYKLLFGKAADSQYQATFQIIPVLGTSKSSGELKIGVIQAIDDFFLVSNWDFGETFYYTELAAYIHQRLATSLATVVIVPTYGDSKFGSLFQVKAESNEIFVSCATIDNVEIVTNLNSTNLRIGN